MMKMSQFKSTVRPVVVCGSLVLLAATAAPLAAALLLSPGANLRRSDCAARMTTTTTRLFASDGASSSGTSSGTAISSLPRLVKTNENGGGAASEVVSTDEVAKKLSGKRVAYYFGAGWCPMCTSFDPSLLKFRQAANESGKDVELIYVPSDRSMPDAVQRCAALNILYMVPFGDDADAVKKEYNVWAGSESLKLGFGRRSGVPALVVLSGETGKELAFLPAEAQGVKALQAWPMDDAAGVW